MVFLDCIAPAPAPSPSAFLSGRPLLLSCQFCLSEAPHMENMSYLGFCVSFSSVTVFSRLDMTLPTWQLLTSPPYCGLDSSVIARRPPGDAAAFQSPILL